MGIAEAVIHSIEAIPKGTRIVSIFVKKSNNKLVASNNVLILDLIVHRK